jgi:hypothetical protein
MTISHLSHAQRPAALTKAILMSTLFIISLLIPSRHKLKLSNNFMKIVLDEHNSWLVGSLNLICTMNPQPQNIVLDEHNSWLVGSLNLICTMNPQPQNYNFEVVDSSCISSLAIQPTKNYVHLILFS